MKIKQLLEQAEAILVATLARVPFVSAPRFLKAHGEHADGEGRELRAEIEAYGEKRVLACQVQPSAQPRQARAFALELREQARLQGVNVYPILMAPYLSSQSIAVCEDAGIGALDFLGNARLVFGPVYIERTERTDTPRRLGQSRNPFASKSMRILRVLLDDPSIAWKVQPLSEAAGVSLGQVSYVRQALLDQEWAVTSNEGIRIQKPREVLDAWRAQYKRAHRAANKYYTVLHGAALERAMAEVLEKSGKEGHALLASFSAARWIAPYARIVTNFFYANHTGEADLTKGLRLESAARGENIVIYRPRDEGVLLDQHELAPGMWGTGAVQTYLDMAVSGERGEEAAEHLFETVIAPKWRK